MLSLVQGIKSDSQDKRSVFNVYPGIFMKIELSLLLSMVN
jgi:hypothetical protein